MDDDLNVTYITLYGYVEMGTYRFFYFFIMFTVYILAMCFSVTIVYLICIHRNLHEPMYIFIAALLMNSIVYNTAMYPNLLYNILAKKHIISYSACLLQLFVFYSLSASDFFLLSAMAYDRYVSICKPLQYTTIMRKYTVTLILLLAWLVPFCELVVTVILSADSKLCHLTLNAIFCNNLVYTLHCVTSRVQAMFDVFALLSMALFPLFFIYFTYIRILTISYRSSREVRTKASQTCLPHVIVLSLFSCLCAYDVIISQMGSNIHFIMTFQAFLYYPLFYPIIYGLKMKEISKHIKRLFCQAKLI
ncbi:olfactory receptor 6N2-like [Centropristis striata]|uniref:olfactory receptor 6N2-like n=1 Tax=Centropristis striata TaxID=184440 RepID=UPI0027DFFFEA|nr:olfactory receptor 6N2-like [Centropristis striata]